jgi:hypothetical protein
MNSDIFSYKEMFSVLMFILVIIMVTEKSFPSYGVPLTHNQLNIAPSSSGHMYGDENVLSNLGRSSHYTVPPTYNQSNSGHMYGDDNAFSNLSRNTTFSAGSANVTSPTNSIGPNFSVGDIRDNNFGHFGPDGMGGYNIRSGSIFAQHGPSNWWPHIWMHHFR